MNDVIMKRIRAQRAPASLLSCLCLGLWLVAGGAFAQAVGAGSANQPAALRPVDSIVAVVNDAVITRNQLDARVRDTKRQLTLQGRPVPDDETLQQQVLDQMILIDVQLQRAKEDGITVSDDDLSQAIQRVAADNKMSVDQYKQRLASMGVSWSVFRTEVRDQMLIARVRQAEVDSKVEVSQSEIDAYLASQNNGQAQDKPTEYHVAQIVIGVPDNATADQVSQAKRKADDLLAQVKGGADFAALAEKYSNGEAAAKGGDLGYRIAERLPDLLLDAVKNLKGGEVVPQVLRGKDGFHIVKLLDVRQGGASAGMLVPQIHARHILIKIGNGVTAEQAREQLLEIKHKIEAGDGTFAEYAKKYSADGSASQGGDLGWLSPGETVPAFERALSTLKDGQISDPVRTQFGYHLIQVLGHREERVTGDQERNLALQEIRARKAEAAYRNWLLQLRDSAYVDNRLNQPG
ncbi:molecular chaperone SurA [Pandoraea thiooxydans]|uniref:Chaperone SurA n=2 Tax=Pandoraea thiooxydans TaxID=445709 RepID=A0A0G3EWG6_9BURK|nr:molecular chaperone SurA [Pandoraea thiooxydans]